MAEFSSTSGQRPLRSRSEAPECSAATASNVPIEVKPVVHPPVFGNAEQIKQIRKAVSRPPVARKAVGPPPIPKLTVGVMPVETMLTTVQAAVILVRKPDVVKKWRRREGKGPSFVRYPDGAIRYRLCDLLDFINNHRVQG
jgi:hypothetical protein